jgi:hypothetical protein
MGPTSGVPHLIGHYHAVVATEGFPLPKQRSFLLAGNIKRLFPPRMVSLLLATGQAYFS